MSNIYSIEFKGSWLGGKAIIKARSKKSAYKILSGNVVNLENIEKCKIEKIDDSEELLYLDNGDY